MKKLFTFFFALLSACTFSAYAVILEGTCGDNLTWILNTKDSTLVISGEGEMDSYLDMFVFPSWYDYTSYIKYVTVEDGVTSIGGWAFRDCSKLTSITIPNSVTSIGGLAFSYCSSLTSVTLGSGLTSIGSSAFGYCSGLTSIEIPNSVTSIGGGAFIRCSGLTSVTIGNSVTSIGSSAFEGCTGLTSITIPNSVTSIGGWAFRDCSGLTSITIPNSVTSIGWEAFENCYRLTKTNYTGDVAGWCRIQFSNGSSNPICYSNNLFFNDEELKNLVIPNTVDTIYNYAFYKCSGLTSITIPNSVTSIGEGAFENCSGLTSVTLGNSVTSIGYYAFYDCYNIQEVTAYMPTPPDAKDCGLNRTAATLYVPAEYLDIYSNTLWWEDFKKIRAIGSDWDVEFVDWDGTILATMKVPTGEAATAPADPVREGYTFIGWDSDFSSVIEDMTVTAQYQINRYQVRFLDWNDTVLKTDSVDYQSAATAPADPVREGYTFIGWDKDFSSITADLDVHAQYEAGADKDLTVVYSDRDNNEISTQTLTFRIPLAPEIEGFTFLYWQPVAAPINDVITIQAVYEGNSPAAAPEIYVNPANPAQKLIRNGQVYILQEDKMYTISGQVVK